MTTPALHTIDPDCLHQLIGTPVNYKGTPCRIIEVLDDGPALVLKSITPNAVIQANRFGEATRRSPETYTVAVYPEGSEQPNPFVLRLLDAGNSHRRS